MASNHRAILQGRDSLGQKIFSRTTMPTLKSRDPSPKRDGHDRVSAYGIGAVLSDTDSRLSRYRKDAADGSLVPGSILKLA
jgi:hypothetical protein